MTTIPRDFWLAVRRGPRRTQIAAGGRLVFGHGADLRLWLPYIAASAGQSIEIDLGGVTEIDARALGLMLELAYCADAGSTLRFVRASPRVLRLVRLTGLDTLLSFPAAAPEGHGRAGRGRSRAARRYGSRRRRGQRAGSAGEWRNGSNRVRSCALS